MTEITQADRDAAAAVVYEENKGGLNWASAKGMSDHVAEGKWDWHPVVKAFARHREAAAAEERAAIVAWLRSKDTYDFDDLAIDIEAKEHLK